MQITLAMYLHKFVTPSFLWQFDSLIETLKAAAEKQAVKRARINKNLQPQARASRKNRRRAVYSEIACKVASSRRGPGNSCSAKRPGGFFQTPRAARARPNPG